MKKVQRRTITVDDISGPDAPRIKQIVRERRLKPTESDFKGKPGYWQKPKANGGYEWGYKYTPNDGHGKHTKQGHEVMEMLRPSQVAEAERSQAEQAAVPRERFRVNGEMRYVNAALADDTARRGGWSPLWRGRRVERGIDGMLWSRVSREWLPLHRWCLGTPSTQSSRPKNGRSNGEMRGRGTQTDPSGNVWKWDRGEWRRQDG